MHVIICYMYVRISMMHIIYVETLGPHSRKCC